MLLRIVKSILGGQGNSPASGASYRADSTFVRDRDVPSVLIYTHSYRGNGAAEMLLFLVRRLMLDRGWQVHAVSTGLAIEDCQVLDRLGIGLVESVDPEQYDFALANTLVSGLSLVESLEGQLPCLLWAHEAEAFLWSCERPVTDLKRAFAMAGHIVFQSTWQAERIFGSFTSTLPIGRYSVIPNCLPSMPVAGQPPRPRIPGSKRIAFVGSVYQRKHPGDLAEAVQLLARQDVECIFVGDTDKLHSLTERHQLLLQNDPRLVLAGLVSRQVATDYLASADVLCLPSADESQPLVLLEAAHLGVPIIISDLPVYRGMWANGTNCMMHAVGDVQGLAECLRTCLEGQAPRPSVSRAIDLSQERFLESFDGIYSKLRAVRRQ